MHGKPLRECDSRTLFEIGYAAWMEHYMGGEEAAKGRSAFEKIFSDRIIEDATGVPAVVRGFPSADATKFKVAEES